MWIETQREGLVNLDNIMTIECVYNEKLGCYEIIGTAAVSTGIKQEYQFGEYDTRAERDEEYLRLRDLLIDEKVLLERKMK